MIRIFRKNLGLSIEGLADLLSGELGRKITKDLMRRYELGINQFTVETLIAVAKVLEVSTDELLGLPVPWWKQGYVDIVSEMGLQHKDINKLSGDGLREEMVRVNDMVLRYIVNENTKLRTVLESVEMKIHGLIRTSRPMEPMVPESIGPRIRHFREYAGLSMDEFARALSGHMEKTYSTDLVGKYERGEIRKVFGNVAAAMAKVLEISLDELLGVDFWSGRIDGLLDFGDIEPTVVDLEKNRDLRRYTKQELKVLLSELYTIGNALMKENMLLKDRYMKLNQITEHIVRYWDSP